MITPSGSGGSLGELEASALLASEDILSRDDIPDENQQRDCFSCGETLTGLFCHSCGQKNDDYRRSIWSLITEAFASVFSLENRMWRTWMMLIVKPGKVSREFSDGKRTAWTSPVRMYLALSIILFGYMSLTETRIFSIRTDIVPRATFKGPVEELPDTAVKLKPGFGFFRRQAEIDKLNENVDFGRVSKLLQGEPRQEFIFDGDLDALALNPTDKLLKSSQSWPDKSQFENSEIALVSLRETAIENYREKIDDVVSSYNLLLSTSGNPKIIDKILESKTNNETFDLLSELGLSGIENVEIFGKTPLQLLDNELDSLGLNRDMIHTLPVEMRQRVELGTAHLNGVKLSQNDIQSLIEQILKNPVLLNDGISKYLPRIMFLMMPFAAIIGMVFIRGKKTALLYDHLVHATYIHAVTFAFLFLLILLAQWTPMTGLISLFFLGIAIYLPISAKNKFQRGWFKSIFASYSIALLYGFNLILIVTFLTASSVFRAIQAGQV